MSSLLRVPYLVVNQLVLRSYVPVKLQQGQQREQPARLHVCRGQHVNPAHPLTVDC